MTDSVFLAVAMLALWIFSRSGKWFSCCGNCACPGIANWRMRARPRDEFEELGDMTDALTGTGFELLDECKLRPAQHEQYYRIFIREDGRVQATIGYIAQGPVGFHFVAFTSNAKDGGAG